jgi:hypothetical protein
VADRVVWFIHHNYQTWLIFIPILDHDPDSTFGIRGVVRTDGKKFKVETLSLPLLSGGMAAYYSLLP